MKPKVGYNKPQDTADRRLLIKKLRDNDGFKGVVDLRRILDEKYNIQVSRNCLYRDLESLPDYDAGDIKAFNARVLAEFKKKLNRIAAIAQSARETGNTKLEMSAIKQWEMMSKSYLSIVNQINARDMSKYEKVEQVDKKKEPTVIRFEK